MEEKNNFFIKFSIGLKSFFISAFCTIFLIFVLAVFLCYSNVSEKIIDTALIIISSFSIMLGGVFMEKNLKQKGLLYGSVFGIVYMIVLFSISSLMNGDFSIEINSVIMILLGILAGCFGGIIGVNFYK